VAVCKQCSKELERVEYRVTVIETPYNPESPPIYVDAGIFCSDGCVVTYFGGRRDY